MKVVSLVDEQRDRLAGALYELAQLPFPPFALCRDPYLLLVGEIVERRGDQGRDGRARGVNGKAFGDDHSLFAGDLVLQAMEEHGLPDPDRAGDCDQAPGTEPGTHRVADPAMTVGFVEARTAPLLPEVVALHDFRIQHRGVSFRASALPRGNLPMTACLITAFSRVRPTSSLTKARSSSARRASGRCSMSEIPRRASSLLA